ncbi:hypothetical protein LW062_001376 [Salmonella enterica]|nr:hypothetical protein [Salmonella enterica]EIP5396646.1 hypothetical protein [Salmonella enterica]EIQ2508833.1 hypothetical protein [Salmonella enterica]EIR4254817.1 hypothetical protein [Salmonella enterica]EIS2463289.1 hypothetical protein [Salmonella enterica]
MLAPSFMSVLSATVSAAILECYGDKQPSWHALRKDWGVQGAVLVRFRLVNSDMATDPEVVGIIN